MSKDDKLILNKYYFVKTANSIVTKIYGNVWKLRKIQKSTYLFDSPKKNDNGTIWTPLKKFVEIQEENKNV